jgi:type I restriction enzyme S subunit
MEIDLPEGWEILELGSVCKLKNGFAFKSTEYQDEGVPVIRISDIMEGVVTNKKSVRVLPNIEFDSYQIEDNDILVAMSGATTGKFGIYKSTDKAYQNQRVGKFQILDENRLNRRFLYYHLHALKRQIEKDAYGGAQPNISSAKIEAMSVTIPHLKEQEGIVEKIEELFSELDKGIENLKTAQQQLKVYRQAVLKWAFEGKLTNENVKDGELPKGWEKLEMGKTIEQPKYGTAKKCGYGDFGRAVLRIPNVVHGAIDRSDLKYAEFDDKEIETYRLKDGDLIIIRSNGSVDIVGKCALVTKKDEHFLYAGYLIRLRPNKIIQPKYLLHILSSSELRNQIENKAKSTSGVNNINAEELKGLVISICKLEEQSKVVQEIESRLSVCDKMEETITNSLLQAKALRESILKKAFEGKLVEPVNYSELE